MTDQNAKVSKLHHFVPQAYLRGFANERQQVVAVPLSGKKPFQTVVKNVAAQTHFNRIEEAAEPDEFERALSTVEDIAMKVVRKLVEGRTPISADERANLAYFIALQAERGPDARRTREFLLRQSMRLEIGINGRKGMADWFEENFGHRPDEDTAQGLWERAVSPEGPPVTMNTASQLSMMLDTADMVLPFITGRQWSIVTFARRRLVTSDAPVALLPDPNASDGRGTGWATSSGFTFPLTRNVGLRGSNIVDLLDTAPDDTRDALRDRVAAGMYDFREAGTVHLEKIFNINTTFAGREYVYHHPDDADYLPEPLPQPTLVNARMLGGIKAEDFDGSGS